LTSARNASTTGYLLALGIAVPLSTWGLRRFGSKRLWMGALAVFFAGSVGSSLAWNVDSLIAWRVVQGAGGGMVNVPFCVAGLILAARYLPADKLPAGPKPRLDLPGLALLAPGVAAVILGLSDAGSSAGFAHPGVIVPLATGVALIGAFTGYALRLGRRGGQPLVDVSLLSRRPVASASAVLFFSGFSLYGAMLLLPLFYQEVRGASALAAGIMLVPQGIGTLLSRNVAGRLTDKIGARPIAAAGFVIVAAATAPFAFAGPHTNPWLLALWLVIRGFGLGAVTIPVMAVAFLGLAKEQVSDSSVITRMVQQIGGSFGTAVLAVILTGSVTAHPGDLAAGFHLAFWWATGFSVIAVLLSLCLPTAPRPKSAPAAPEPAPAGLPDDDALAPASLPAPAPRRA
jgi:MFS family permease